MAETTKTLEWDKTGSRTYETGVEKCVLYPAVSGAYPKGVAWNGITAINETPSGGEASALYADNIKYLNLISNEELGLTVEAYTYPDEFAECDGSADLGNISGVSVGQQKRNTFGLSYVTKLGNDDDGADHGYKIHIIYGCLAAPSERAYATVNDSPEAITFSWTISTTPVTVPNMKPTSRITIDSTKFTSTEAKAKLKALEDALYGTTSADPYLPLPAKLIELLGTTSGATESVG